MVALLSPERRRQLEQPQAAVQPEFANPPASSLVPQDRVRKVPGPTPPVPTKMRDASMQMEGAIPKVPPMAAPKLENVPTAAPKARQTPIDVNVERGTPLRSVGAGKEIPGVSGRLQGLLSSRSPYIQRARTSAARAANRRGLLNTSIAAGSGEAAAIDAALPIASADAQLAAGERSRFSQEFQQYRGIRSQELMQKRGLSHDAAQQEASRELQNLMQRRDLRVRQLMQHRQISHEAAQAQANREMQAVLQERSFAHAAGMQERDHLANQLMQERGLTHEAAQAEADRLQQTAVQERDILARELMQERGLTHEAAQAEADRLQQTAMQETSLAHSAEQAEATRAHQAEVARNVAIVNINGDYNRQVAIINNNPDIPADARREMIADAEAVRDSTLAAVGYIEEHEPEFSSAAGQGG